MAEQDLFLLDSTIWIHLARKRFPRDVVEHIASLVDAGSVATNDVIRTEVLVGSRSDEEFARNSEVLAGHVQLEITALTWRGAAELGFRLLRNGIKASLPDLLIAVNSMENDAVLLHADHGLERVANQTGARAESYLREIRI